MTVQRESLFGDAEEGHVGIDQEFAGIGSRNEVESGFFASGEDGAEENGLARTGAYVKGDGGDE